MSNLFGESRFLRRTAEWAHRSVLVICSVLLLVTACYSPNLSGVTDCTVPCFSDCPSGFECRNNFCARVESSATCAAGGSGGGVIMTSIGGGGAGNASGIGGGGMGGSSTNVAGAAGSAGTAGAGALEIEASTVASLCPGQGFTVQLSVVGGTAPYVWTLDASSAAATRVSSASSSAVTATGLANKSQPELKVVVHDANNATASKSVALTVAAAGVGECPIIQANALPSPCIANPYNANDIVVTGGTAPFTWTALSIPDGLTFDVNQQTISGTALASGASTPLTLQVTDAKGLQTQLTYPLVYRDKCWLGFTSTKDGDAQVHLFDPALKVSALALEESPNNTTVVDFKFSPDGKFLVYRRAASSGGAQDLVLAAAPNWQDQVVDLGGSVLEYSWSQGAAVLAVAFLDGSGNTMLGGVNVTSAVVGASGGITGLQVLVPVQMQDSSAPPLDTDLIWIQSDHYIAYHADAGYGGGLDFPFYAHLDSAGFSAVAAWGTIPYLLPIQLQAAQNGLFVIDATDPPVLNFVGTEGDLDYDLYLSGSTVTGVADPSGRYVATPASNKLQLFFTAESGGTTDPPTAWPPSADDCASILAWDVGKERIACDATVTEADGGTTGEVRLFDLDASGTTPQLNMTAVKQLSGYLQGASVGHRRSFSGAGSWLALTTDTELYVANVQQEPQLVLQLPTVSGSLPTDTGELAFSPDESLLLWQLGQRLAVVALKTNGISTWYSADTSLLAPDPCNEQFQQGPDAWCGKLKGAKAPAWAPDSRFAASLTAAHTVGVFDFKDYASGGVIVYNAACQIGCSGDFAFQP
jgi:hypothetical protein